MVFTANNDIRCTMTMIPLVRATLLEPIGKAFASGPPNGWVLGWKIDRHFLDFARIASPFRTQNLTTLDYAFCNHFEARIDGQTSPSRKKMDLPLAIF